jgi:hypothetical protein
MKKNYTLFLFFFMLFSIKNTQAQSPALNFDGTNDYVQTTYSGIAGSADRTIEAWIRTTGNFVPGGGGGVQGVIVDYGTFVTGQRFTFNVLWGNAIRLEVGGNGISGSIAVNDGSWHHVAAVYTTSGNTVKLYVDGVLDTQGSLTVSTNTGTGTNVVIGRRIDNINNFDGDIDEVRFYNFAKTQAQIAADMNSEFCSIPTGLVGYWKLNEGTANGTNTGNTNAADYSGNGNNGTLNGFALTGTSSNWITGKLASTLTTSSAIAISQCTNYTSPSGQIWTTTGNYIDTIPNAGGCDSIIFIGLTIGSTTSSISPTACLSYTSPNGTVYTTSGVYTNTLTNGSGCDSIITINLTIGSSGSNISTTTCDSYTSPNGTVYTTSGTYTNTLTSAAGCDSVVTINLTVNNSTTSTDTIIACNSALVNGTEYFTSQDVSYTLSTATGCDSTVAANIQITTIDTSVTVTNGTITANNQTGANYSWIDCATGTPITGATNSSFTPTQNGNYAVVIDLNNCSETSTCTSILNVSNFNIELSTKLQVIPNPNSGQFRVELEAIGTAENYMIYDALGRVVISKTIQTNQFMVNENLSSGVYFIIINTTKGRLSKKIMVN